MSTQPTVPSPTVPIIGPDGTLGDVPYEQMKAAISAGGKPGVTIKAPDGSIGIIPADQTQAAVKAGGAIVPIKDQETQHPGFWNSLWSDVKSIPSAITAPDPFSDPRVSDADKWKLYQEQLAAKQATNAERVKEHGQAYSLGASANEMLGVNVAGEEEAAKEGDVGGVAGHAAAVPVITAAGEAIAAGGPAAVEAARPHLEKAIEAARNATPKQVAQAVGGAGGAVAGHGALSVPGAHYGAKVAGGVTEAVLGKERANAPIRTGPPATPELDATAENKPFAGGPDEYVAPKSRAELDATGENRKFAGGLDEPPVPKKPAGSVPRTVVTAGASLPEEIPQGGVHTTAAPKDLLDRWGVDEKSFTEGRSQTRGMKPDESAAAIKTLTERYKNGQPVDPLLETRDSENNIVDVDGRGRALAAQKAGVERVPIIVRRLRAPQTVQ